MLLSQNIHVNGGRRRRIRTIQRRRTILQGEIICDLYLALYIDSLPFYSHNVSNNIKYQTECYSSLLKHHHTLTTDRYNVCKTESYSFNLF